MLSDLLWLMAALLAVALVYRFRKPVLLALARFDARNAARQAEEAWEKRDRIAPYRRAVLNAEESLERVMEITVPDERTGQKLKRYVFLGEHYATRNEAETARRIRALEIARDFYAEMDGVTLPPRPPAPAPAALPEPDKEPTPPRPS